MSFDSLFLMAIQSSLILGLIHGINPCGHSWLILAPFTVGNKSGKQVSLLTMSFIAGTSMACLVLGASLGTISTCIPDRYQLYVEIGTAIILIILGLILIIKPHLLHHHHEHEHEHEHHHHTNDCQHKACSTENPRNNNKKATLLALFSIGFVNMIIPCPTVAIMYGYALESGNAFNALVVFAAYAFTTGITVSLVIFTIYKVTNALHALQQDWLETAIMRGAGALTILFSTISLASHL